MESSLQELFNQKLEAFLESNKNLSRIFIALSGGMDSIVLLHLCQRFFEQSTFELPLAAIHVNHSISAQSNQWQLFCEQQCQSLGVHLICETISVVDGENSKQGLESRARKLRYQIFRKHCQEEAVLLMAHHQDDQVETFLFRLFRGNGGNSLTGIPALRELDKALLFRPLLDINRDMLLSWAKENNLQWVEDESNQDTYFSRNFIRREILPLIKSRWPSLNESLSRVLRLQFEQHQVLREVAKEDFERLLCKEEILLRWGQCLDMNGLLSLSVARQKNLLRFWMSEMAIQMPSAHRLENLLAIINQKPLPAFEIMSWKDDEHSMIWHGFEQQLYLIKQPATTSDQVNVSCWDLEKHPSQTIFNELYTCQTSEDKKFSLDRCFSKLQIKYRSEGLRCQPVTRDKSQLLKKLFQEYRVPPWERDHVPLFYCDVEGQQNLVAVGDLWVCKGFEARDGKGWRISRMKRETTL